MDGVADMYALCMDLILVFKITNDTLFLGSI